VNQLIRSVLHRPVELAPDFGKNVSASLPISPFFVHHKAISRQRPLFPGWRQHTQCRIYAKRMSTIHENLARAKSLLRTKQGSWVLLVNWVEDQPRYHPDSKPFAAFVLPLLKACLDAGLDEYFRAGQSMSHIIFSTADKHGLDDPSQLRITIKSEDNKHWYVARSYGNLWFAAPDRETSVDADTAFQVLKQYLADLWLETRPGDPIPQPLLPR
jgi:hypothetical protein